MEDLGWIVEWDFISTFTFLHSLDFFFSLPRACILCSQFKILLRKKVAYTEAVLWSEGEEACLPEQSVGGKPGYGRPRMFSQLALKQLVTKGAGGPWGLKECFPAICTSPVSLQATGHQFLGCRLQLAWPDHGDTVRAPSGGNSGSLLAFWAELFHHSRAYPACSLRASHCTQCFLPSNVPSWGSC